ncbi:MAG TPA: transporter [Burkholderiales bacterium]|nr:transporter [Burkholderiales bacterium]
MRAALLAAALIPALSLAQELEPRAYSNAPVGTSFAIAGYTRLSGDVLPSPALAAIDIDAQVNMYTLGYARFLDVLGRTASVTAVLPYVEADVRGATEEASREVHRGGVGDLYLRGALNLFGNPALKPAEFAKRADALSGGVSLNVVAPTGQYESSRFINIGTNRWAFKPDAGISYPIGNWFTEAAAGVWFFTDNDNFLLGHRRSQEPLAVYQLHAGYNFRPGLWLAADYGRYIGGRTSIDGAANDDEQHNSRVGLALSLPVGRGWSTKLAYSKGTVVRVGGDYRIISVAVQYRWFD